MSTTAALASFLPHPNPPPSSSSSSRSFSFPSSAFFPRSRVAGSPQVLVVVEAGRSGFDGGVPRRYRCRSSSKNSVLLNLIHEIEPLDVSLIQKDVPADTVDAMKRTISSMLGLLPSDQFHVLVEAFWEPLSKLLFSSIMTGYTLRNAEYRLCLERNLDISGKPSKNEEGEIMENPNLDVSLDSNPTMSTLPSESDFFPSTEDSNMEHSCQNIDVEDLDDISPQVKEYIQQLQSRLSSTEKELSNARRKNAALEMQHFAGDEKNDLLDYLRSIQPEKVVELSEPSCPEVRETVRSVVHGLLATLSPKVHTQPPLQSENPAAGTPKDGKDDCAELVENTSIQFQPLISLSRDYLARLLFWCMLLGHYIRGLEYRLQLVELLALPSNPDCIAPSGDQVS